MTEVYRHQDDVTLPALLVICEGNLLVLCEGNPSVTGGFPSQRTINAGLDMSIVLARTYCWRNTRVGVDVIMLIVTSLIWNSFGERQHPWSTDSKVNQIQAHYRYKWSSTVHHTWFVNVVQTRWHVSWQIAKSVGTLQWRHAGRDSVSYHQPHDCLLNRLFRRRSKKTSKFRVTSLFAGNSPGTGEFPHKWLVTRKMFPFDDVIMMHRIQQSYIMNVKPMSETFRLYWKSCLFLGSHCCQHSFT